MSRQGEIRIGISGWRYKGWRGVFYPEKLAQRRELEFASSRFNTIELNGKTDGKRDCPSPIVAGIVGSTVRQTEQWSAMGCGGLVMMVGAVAFVVAAVVWWLATGRVPHELWEVCLVCFGFFLFDLIGSSINSWRDESKETAKTVQELLERMKGVEESVEAIKKQTESLGSHLDQFKSEFDESAESIREDARQGLSQLESIEERVRNLDAK
jgi:gas vesicle protein